MDFLFYTFVGLLWMVSMIAAILMPCYLIVVFPKTASTIIVVLVAALIGYCVVN